MKIIFNSEEIDKGLEFLKLYGERKRGAVFMDLIEEDSSGYTTYIRDAFLVENRLQGFLAPIEDFSFSDLRKESRYYPNFITQRTYANSVADKVRSSFEEDRLEIIPPGFSGRKKDALKRVKELVKLRLTSYIVDGGVEQILIPDENPVDREFLLSLIPYSKITSLSELVL